MVYANKSIWDLDGLIAPLGSIEEGLTTVAIEIERLRVYEGNISTQNLDNIFAMMSAYSQTVEHLKRIRSYKKIVDENYSRNDGEPDSKNPENETEFKSSTQILA